MSDIVYYNEGEMPFELTKQYDVDKYPYLVNEVMQHIEKIKGEDKEMSLVDIIVDYGLKNNVDIELIGDAISNDVYFKSFIKKDCELHRIFRTDQPEEW